MIVGDGNRRRKWYTIDLSTEQRSEVSKETRKEKCEHDSIEVATTLFPHRMSLDSEDKYKTYDRTKKRKKIVLWDKKQFQKVYYFSIEEFNKDELLIEPISHDMEYA